MLENRRKVLGIAATWAGLAVAATMDLIRPVLAMVKWPQAAFDSKDLDELNAVLLDGAQIQQSDQIALKAPDIAENGAVVPVKVSTTLEGVESINIVVEKNPAPLVASFVIGAGAMPDIATRIKMGETSQVIALVKTKDQAFSASKEVKVTIGGCGG